MAAFAIEGVTRERVEVEVLDYERASIGDSDDDNWLSVEVSVSAGAFAASYPAQFRTEEIVQFRDQVEMLYQSLRGEAKFFTLDDQLSLCLTGNGRGEITARGIAVDSPGTGNRLEFCLMLDQAHLRNTLVQLREVIEAFPVRAG